MSLDLKLFEACEESHGIRCQRLGSCGQNIEEWHQKSSSPTKYMCDSSISAQQFKTILHFRRSLQRLRRGLEDALCTLPWADQHELLILVKSPVNTEPYERMQPLLRSFFGKAPFNRHFHLLFLLKWKGGHGKTFLLAILQWFGKELKFLAEPKNDRGEQLRSFFKKLPPTPKKTKQMIAPVAL